LLVTSFNFLFLLAGTGGDDDDEEAIVVITVDDDGDEEDTNDKDVGNDCDALSSTSITFSKMKFHINGSAILQMIVFLFRFRSIVGGL